MSRTDPQFNLRIPEPLRDKVMEAAKTNKRSATAEILARLEETFEPEEAPEEVAHSLPVAGISAQPCDIYEEINRREMGVQVSLDSSNARLSAIEQQIKQMLEILTRK